VSLIYLARNMTHYQDITNTVKKSRIPVEGREFLDMPKKLRSILLRVVGQMIISAGSRVPNPSFCYKPPTTEAPQYDGNTRHSGLSTTQPIINIRQKYGRQKLWD
jgi:hypothetical protein